MNNEFDTTNTFEEGFNMDVEDIDEDVDEDMDEESPEVNVESEQEESTPAAEVNATPTEETIDYSYNHSTTPLPRASVEAIGKALGFSPEEVVTRLQKGSNYDTLMSRQQPYDPLIEQIRTYAADNSMDVKGAINKVQDALNVVSAGKYVAEIRQKYPNAPPQMIQELAVARAREASRTSAIQRQQMSEQDRERAWVSFFNAHPDAKAATLSPRMLEALDKGEDPEKVYSEERISLLQKELNELKQKTDNASRSTGSAKTTSGAQQKDAFLDGFLT